MTKSASRPRIGSFTFDVRSEELQNAEGLSVPLRPQTARVLAMLVARNGELVSKDDLMSEVWADTHVTDDSLVQCISEIRKALGPYGARYLKTVPKQGYRLQPVFTYPVVGANWSGLHKSAIVLLILLFATLLAIFAYQGMRRVSDDPERMVIAVLPFTNVGSDEDQEYFALGLAEDLLTDLSKIEAITVLSRESTFSFREQQAFAENISVKLGATHFIDGSVRRDGDRVRINVQLIDTKTGNNIWAERYDRKLEDLFKLQDKVRSQIMQALAIRLAPGDAERMRSGETTAVLAYDLLLRGRREEATLGSVGVVNAIRLYERAISVDPTYGVAYARLANMYDFASRFGWSEDPARDALLAVQLAETAIALGPHNPFAYWTYGRVLSRRGMDTEEIWARAVLALEKSIELDPNYADAYAFIGLLHIANGDAIEAKAALTTALSLNPIAPYWYLQNSGIVAYMEGDYDAAIHLFEKAVHQSPTTPSTRTWLAAAYARVGRTEDAEWEIEEAVLNGSPDSLSGVLNSNRIFRNAAYLNEYAVGLRKAGLRQ